MRKIRMCVDTEKTFEEGFEEHIDKCRKTGSIMLPVFLWMCYLEDILLL